MTLSTALCAAVGVLAIGTSALWSNPYRPVNRAVAGVSVYLAIWFVLYHLAIAHPQQPAWSQATWFAAGFFPLALRLLRDVGWVRASWHRSLLNLKGWWLCPLIFGGLTAGPAWVARDGAPMLMYSSQYYMVLIAGLLIALIFVAAAIFELQGARGVRRLELQLCALGGGSALFATHSLPLIAAMSHDGTWDRLAPLAVLAIYGGLAWSLLTSRLLDAKHILTLGLEKLILVSAVTAFVWGIQRLAIEFIPDWLALGVAIALGLWFAAAVRPLLQEGFQRKAGLERLRKAAFEIARREVSPAKLEEEFLKLLTEWANTDRVVILMASQGRLIGGGIDCPADAPELKLLQSLRWATPERLARESPRNHSDLLAAWLRAEKLGAMVAGAGPSLAFVVAVGVPRTERPLNYPEIFQLLSLQPMMEAAFSRAHYLMKAQHAEQLATVGLLGASIAHEIRNPLVSIKTFVQLLPQKYQDPAFREKFFRLIGDEVGRIDRLTEQLLDLSSPRVFMADETAIHLLLSECIDLVTAKADDNHVKISTHFEAKSDIVYTDPNALKQVILNLGFNALQAMEAQDGQRLLEFKTAQHVDRLEIVITDSGPGISDEVWGRLFEPFHSTKSSGFGLGLAICKDILSNLDSSITADSPVQGRGATFRIDLPCQPPTS